MKKNLSSLLFCAALIPSFSYAYQSTDVCYENVYIRGVSIIPDKDKNAWKIFFDDTPNGDSSSLRNMRSDLGYEINLDYANGRATFAMALTAMHMKLPVKIIDTHSHIRLQLVRSRQKMIKDRKI